MRGEHGSLFSHTEVAWFPMQRLWARQGEISSPTLTLLTAEWWLLTSNHQLCTQASSPLRGYSAFGHEETQGPTWHQPPAQPQHGIKAGRESSGWWLIASIKCHHAYTHATLIKPLIAWSNLCLGERKEKQAAPRSLQAENQCGERMLRTFFPLSFKKRDCGDVLLPPSVATTSLSPAPAEHWVRSSIQHTSPAPLHGLEHPNGPLHLCKDSYLPPSCSASCPQ